MRGALMKRKELLIQLLLYLNAFLLGFVLMGFEMLGSRYLYPYYGGSIETWAALISTVLVALMIGYFLGGIVVDKFPSIFLLGILISLSSVYLAIIPKSADPILNWMIDIFGDQASSVLVASLALLLVPLSLLGAYTPFAIRLALIEQVKSGRTSGMIYGISTMGNILGTLITTFYLIPSIGTRSITYLMALLVGCSGISLLLCGHKSNSG
jgi:hypothetical protein